MTFLNLKVPHRSVRRTLRRNVHPAARVVPDAVNQPSAVGNPQPTYRVSGPTVLGVRAEKLASGRYYVRRGAQIDSSKATDAPRKQINGLTTLVRESVQLLWAQALMTNTVDALPVEVIDDTIGDLQRIKEQIRAELSKRRGQIFTPRWDTFKAAYPNFSFVPESAAAQAEANREADPFAAARRRGETYVVMEWSKPENLTLEDASALAGRADRIINQGRNAGEYYALLKPGQSRGFRYPKWQFQVDHARLVAALKPFFEAKTNCWVIHNFMHRPNTTLGGMRPCDYIADPSLPIEQVIKCVKESLPSDQGAA